jgi:hypothetical protein
MISGNIFGEVFNEMEFVEILLRASKLRAYQWHIRSNIRMEQRFFDGDDSSVLDRYALASRRRSNVMKILAMLLTSSIFGGAFGVISGYWWLGFPVGFMVGWYFEDVWKWFDLDRK